MKLYYETDFENFEPWSGAVEVFDAICDAGAGEAAEQLLDELYPEGLSETGLNDLLRFDGDWFLHALGLNDEYEED